MHSQRGVYVGREGLYDHSGAKIGAADADVDHIGDGASGAPLPTTRANGFGKASHHAENPIDIRHHVIAIQEDRTVAAVPKGDMQNGAVFGDIDAGATKHRFYFG